MNVLPLFIISLIALGTYFAFWLPSNRSAGSPELTNCLSIFLIALTFNITFPAALYYLFKDGNLIWARQFSGTSYVTEALLNALLALMAFSIGYVATNFGDLVGRGRRRRSRGQLESRGLGQTASPVALQAMWLAIALGILLKIFVIFTFDDGAEIVARLSGSIRREMILTGAEGKGTQYLIMFSTIAEAAAAMIVAHALKERQRSWVGVATLAFCLIFTYVLTGKRTVTILPLILAISAFSIFYRKISLKHLPVILIAILTLGMGSLLLRILAPQAALGNVVDYRLLGGGSLLDFYLYSPEFAGFDMLVRGVAQGDRIVEALGGRSMAIYKSTIEPFLYLVPRSLWPEKPSAFVDLSHGFYVVTFGGGITDQTPGFAATLIGYAAVLGGPGLVVISFLLLGWLAAAIDKVNPATYGGIVVRALGMALVFNLFRQGSIGWTFLTVIQTMMPAIAIWVAFIALSGRGAALPLVRRSLP